jgi:hypothetical protein
MESDYVDVVNDSEIQYRRTSRIVQAIPILVTCDYSGHRRRQSGAH